MNIVQLQDQLKNFSQDQLVREMQMPSGNAPQFLILGEIMRRKRMQDDFTAQQAKGDQGTVAQEAVAAAGVPQGGIADMARAMAPSTDMTQNTGVQAMYAGGPVKKMAEGDIVVRGGKRYIEQEDGTYAPEEGDSRTWGQRNIGDPLRELLSPVGDAARETLQPVGEDLRSLFAPRPIESVAAAPEITLPEALSYDALVAQARSGTPPTLEQLQSSVEAGLLSGQQAADVQAMAEGTGYVPTQEETRAANMPGLTPVTEYTPPLDTPYEKAKQGIGDFVAGAFGGRTIGEQAAIDAERAAAIAAQRGAQGPAFETRGREQSPRTLEEAVAAQKAAEEETKAAEKAAADEAEKAKPTTTTPSGGAGGAGGMSSYEQELMDALARREKAAEQDKWLALAQVGLNMMASRQPTLLGAVGEAGLKGVEAARSARDQYDKDRLELLGALEQSRIARAKAAAGGGGGLSAYQAASLARGLRKDAADELQTLITMRDSLTDVNGNPFPASLGQYDLLNAQIESRMNELYGVGGAGGVGGVDFITSGARTSG